MSSAVKRVSKNAEIIKVGDALQMNIQAALGLQKVLASNLGPRGTLKMLVSGAGDVKITKDGSVLLSEMQIQHPTASLIARAANSQDSMTGDGTTSNVLLISELLKQANRYVGEGLHPRVISEGFAVARDKALDLLNEFRVEHENIAASRDLLISVAQTSLRSKVRPDFADALAAMVVDAVLTIRREGEPVDLHMVELMSMVHRSDSDSKLVKGLVLDHGARHPDMPRRLTNCFILTCNVSLEYEKTEVNASFHYSSAAERQKLVNSERAFVDERVQAIIELKREVCDTPDKSFVIVNQKGIDPMSLDMLAKEGIFALRRAKRRNMERMTRACGGSPLNSLEDLSADALGHADLVYEHTLGEEKYTFIEGVENPFSCTLLMKGSAKHVVVQIKDAVRDGLRAVKNALEDASLVPGGGAFEIAANLALTKFANSSEVKGRTKLGVLAFAEALLIIPKTLADNSGFDRQDTIVALQEEHQEGHLVGLDLETGEPMLPAETGVWDNFRVKRALLYNCTVSAEQILLVDEVIRAGNPGR